MAQLFYQGHGSFRITTNNQTVVYVDPYAGEGYDIPADIILITHEHFDHNNAGIVSKKPNTRIIRAAQALQNGVYQAFTVNDVKIEAVEAYNRNHKKEECVGYILTVDQITLYAAGDTSKTKQMTRIKTRSLDWALLPIDGIYNMDANEASKCAALINAKHTIPIHMKPGGLFDPSIAESFHAPGRVIVRPNETITL